MITTWTKICGPGAVSLSTGENIESEFRFQCSSFRLMKQVSLGKTEYLACLLVSCRNGKYVGNVTSTAYGFSLGKQVCLGYVHDFDDAGEAKVLTYDYVLKKASYEVDICGKRFKAKAGIYPPKLASAAIVIQGQPRKAQTT